MLNILMPFLVQWGVTSLALCVASYVFKGIRFADTSSLIVSALLLGFANAIVRPLLILADLTPDVSDAGPLPPGHQRPDADAGFVVGSWASRFRGSGQPSSPAYLLRC